MYFFRSPQVRCMGGLVTRRKPSPVSHSSQAVFHSSPAQKTRHLFSQLPSKNTKGNRTRQRKFFCFSLCEFECRSEREGTRQAGRRSSLSACRRDTEIHHLITFITSSIARVTSVKSSIDIITHQGHISQVFFIIFIIFISILNC